MGTGRNGSTLLMRLLDGSPDLWVYPIELNYLRLFGEVRRKNQWIKKIKKKIMGSQYDEYVWFQFIIRQTRELEKTYLNNLENPYQPNRSPVDFFVRNGQLNYYNNGLADFLQAFQYCYDVRSHKEPPMLAFKCTDVENAERYATVFPEMKFLHIVRDPVQNYESLKRTNMLTKKRPFFGTSHQSRDILKMHLEDRWIPHVKFMLNGVHQDSERHHLIKYEALCENPKKIMEGIFDWMNIKMHSGIDKQTVLGGKRLRSLPRSVSQKGIATPEEIVYNLQQKIKYDKVITSREKQFISVLTQKLCGELNYNQLSDNQISRIKLYLEWVGLDKWDTMNLNTMCDWLKCITFLIRRKIYLTKRILFSK